MSAQKCYARTIFQQSDLNERIKRAPRDTEFPIPATDISHSENQKFHFLRRFLWKLSQVSLRFSKCSVYPTGCQIRYFGHLYSNCRHSASHVVREDPRDIYRKISSSRFSKLRRSRSPRSIVTIIIAAVATTITT